MLPTGLSGYRFYSRDFSENFLGDFPVSSWNRSRSGGGLWISSDLSGIYLLGQMRNPHLMGKARHPAVKGIRPLTPLWDGASLVGVGKIGIHLESVGGIPAELFHCKQVCLRLVGGQPVEIV